MVTSANYNVPLFILECPDRQGRACESTSATTISTRDDQHPGRGPGEVEAQVCVLDPRFTHRRQRSRERTLGRASCERSTGPMGEGAAEFDSPESGQVIETTTSDLPILPLFVDVKARYGYDAIDPTLLYDTLYRAVGEEEEKGLPSNTRCFNCGSPFHPYPECPRPHNRELINLTKQLWEFHNPLRPRLKDAFDAIEWRQTRLNWLKTFEPGQVKGELLREALWLRDGDLGEDVEWLRNIAIWGYPKGWTGSVDPRTLVWEKITMEGQQDDEWTEPVEFTIFEENEEIDIILLPDHLKPEAQYVPDSDEENQASPDTASDDSSVVEVEHPDHPPSDHRWVKYPTSYFLYTKLPIYNGIALPSIEHAAAHPPSVLSASVPTTSAAPPPPLSNPPPLPPPPPSIPPPLPSPPTSLPPTLKQTVFASGSSLNPIEILDGDSDMELSDSD